MRMIIGAAVLALAAGAAGTGAQAQLLPQFTGVSEFAQPCGLCDSMVNFAVYRNQDGNWTNDAFFGGLSPNALPDFGGKFGATVDAAASYVYLYQVVNTNQSGGADDPLRDFNLSINSSTVTGAGWLGGAFRDANGTAIGNANPSIVTGYTFGSGDLAADNGTPSALVTDAPLGLGVADDLVAPAGVRTGLSISNPAPAFSDDSIIFGWNVDALIEAGKSSPVLFITTNAAPVYRWAETESQGGFGSANDLPSTPVAEPASMALLGAGLLGIGALRRRRSAG